MAAGVYGLGEIAGDAGGEGFLRGGGEGDELLGVVWPRGDTDVEREEVDDIPDFGGVGDCLRLAERDFLLVLLSLSFLLTTGDFDLRFLGGDECFVFFCF